MPVQTGDPVWGRMMLESSVQMSPVPGVVTKLSVRADLSGRVPGYGEDGKNAGESRGNSCNRKTLSACEVIPLKWQKSGQRLQWERGCVSQSGLVVYCCRCPSSECPDGRSGLAVWLYATSLAGFRTAQSPPESTDCAEPALRCMQRGVQKGESRK